MCSVSMITGHYQTQFPDFRQFPVEQYANYAELVRKAKLYDEMMKQKDCPDPAKEKWHADLEQFMRDKYGLEAK